MTEPDRPPPSLDAGSSTPAAGSDPAGRRLKAGGVFQVIFGVALLLLMGIVTWRMAPSLLAAPEALADGSRFNATQGTARPVLALFASVMVFGVIAGTIGVKQATIGVRPKPLLYLLWAAGALIFVMVLLVVFAIRQGQG